SLTSLGGGTWRFSASHQYLDDTPSGTPADTYQLSVTITDDDGGTAHVGDPTAAELVTNGNFESGDFTGWTITNSASGTWHINDGTFDPEGPATPLAPINGRFDAVASQIGPGQNLLSEAFVVPTNISSA